MDRTSLLLSGGTYIDIGVTKDTNIQVTGIADITPPTANISVKDNSWTTFWNGITFGLFFNETQQVTITAADVGSGVDTVEYFLSEHALEQDALTHKSDWQTYTGAFHIDPDKVCAIYAKVTDKAGNIFYLNSDGLVLDSTAPAISGIEDGKTYYTTQKVTVSDNNLDTVTLNSEAAAEAITLEGNKDGIYTITATDKAGNATSVTVTMKPISAIDDDYQDVTPEDATSGDRQTIKQTLELIETLLQDDDLTEAEKTALEEARADAQALLDASQEKSPIPATGDATYLVLFGSLMVVSAAALVVLLLVTKKRKQ